MQSLLKTLQLSTRQLHHMCGHSKVREMLDSGISCYICNALLIRVDFSAFVCPSPPSPHMVSPGVPNMIPPHRNVTRIKFPSWSIASGWLKCPHSKAALNAACTDSRLQIVLPSLAATVPGDMFPWFTHLLCLPSCPGPLD